MVLKGSLVGIAVLAALPGCFTALQTGANAETPPSAAEGGATTRLPFALRDCDFLVAQAATRASRVQAFLPPGFTPASLVGEGRPEGVIRVGFETDLCAEATGVEGTVPNASYAAIWVGVVPPPGLAVPPGHQPFVAWDWLEPDPVRRGLLAAEGFPAYDGKITKAPWIGNLPITETREWELEGVARFRLEAAGAQPAATTTGGQVIQWVPAADGALSAWN